MEITIRSKFSVEWLSMEPLNMEGMDIYFRLEWPYTGQLVCYKEL